MSTQLDRAISYRATSQDASSLISRLAVEEPVVPEPQKNGRKFTTKSRFYVPFGKVVRKELRELQASAIEVTDKNGQALSRVHEGWQDTALSYYDRCGECRSATNFFAVSLAQIRFFPALRDANGEVKEIEDKQVVDIFNRVKDSTGSLTPIVSAYGRLMFLVGDGYLTCTGTGDTEDPEIWEFLSPTELRVDPDGRFRRIGTTIDTSQLERVNSNLDQTLQKGMIRAWRMWRSHPANSLKADAPTRSVLDLFEELVLLTAAVRARVKSRLASAGILLVPEEITFPSDEAGGDEDPNNDPFLMALIAHMTQPIVEEGTASAVVPFILRGSRDYLDSIRHIKTNDPNETYRESGLRMETINRISIGIDLPPEILTGLAASTHWTAWLVNEQVAKVYIFPIAEMFSNDFASAYLRPACRIAKIANWQQITVGYDPAQLVNHPDKSQNAKDLHDRGEINGATLRQATGFTEENKMSSEEEDKWLAVKLRTPELLRDVPENAPVSPLDKTPSSAKEGPPENQPQLSNRAAKLVGAAELSVTRARSLAGAKLVTKSRNNCPECVEQIKDTPNHQVASVLGLERLTAMNATTRSLVSGTADEFCETAIRWGVPVTAAKALGEQVESFAAKTLCVSEIPPLPEAFEEYVAMLESQ